MSKGNDLIEHPPVVAWIITDRNGFRSVTQSHVSAETMLRLGSEATSLVRLSDYVALRDTIASLSEALAEAEKKGAEALRHIQEHFPGAAAEFEAVYERTAPPRDLSQGGQP